jgi:molecular chaperone GrpE
MDDTHKKHNDETNQEVDNQSVSNDEAKGAASEDNWKEHFLRVNADFQNYKRRAEKERTQWIKTAQVASVRPFLEFLDELEMALAASSTFELSPDVQNWLNGLKLMQGNILKKLESLDIKQIECKGQFNPHFHEALATVDAPGHESGDIVAVLRPGYLYKDEVIRHAQVTVAR